MQNIYYWLDLTPSHFYQSIFQRRLIRDIPSKAIYRKNFHDKFYILSKAEDVLVFEWYFSLNFFHLISVFGTLNFFQKFHPSTLYIGEIACKWYFKEVIFSILEFFQVWGKMVEKSSVDRKRHSHYIGFSRLIITRDICIFRENTNNKLVNYNAHYSIRSIILL